MALSGPGMHLKYWPVPKATHRCSKCSLGITVTDRTTTSVLAVPRTIFWQPRLSASAMCKNILVSASFWVQGLRVAAILSYGGLLRTSLPRVVTRCFRSSKCFIPIVCLARNVNNVTYLFASSLRNCYQLLGKLVLPSTPLHSIFWFPISGYSHATGPHYIHLIYSLQLLLGIWLEDFSCLVIKCFAINWLLHIDKCNTLENDHVRIWGNSATLSTASEADFLPWCNLLSWDSEGGHLWFSRMKNPSISPSHNWQAIYIRERVGSYSWGTVSCILLEIGVCSLWSGHQEACYHSPGTIP